MIVREMTVGKLLVVAFGFVVISAGFGGLETLEGVPDPSPLVRNILLGIGSMIAICAFIDWSQVGNWWHRVNRPTSQIRVKVRHPR